MRRKRVVGLIVLCLFLGSFSTIAEAAGSITPSLSFSGSTASCSVTIKKLGKQISATMELWHGTTKVDSWSGTGISSLTINETHSGCVSGWTYTLKINGTIGGVAFSEVTVAATC